MLLFFHAFFVVLFGETAHASLIASSEVQSCRRTTSDFEPVLSTGEECSNKFVVALAVRNGQGESSHVYANIRHVTNSTGDTKTNQQLQRPFRISVTKSDVHIHYPLRYLTSVNNNPIESWVNVHNVILGIKSCNDETLEENRGQAELASCGYQFYPNGEVIPNSQGYCCDSDFDEKLSRKWKYRRGVGSQVWHYHVHKYSQAICMDHGPLWYHTFEIGQPFVTYKINVTVQEFDTVRTGPDGETTDLWHTIGYATVGPERPGDNTANRKVGETSSPKIKVSWEGDFQSTSSINMLNTKYLMVPDWRSLTSNSHRHRPETVALDEAQLTDGFENWLIADKHLFDFSGRTCNRMGASYEAFRFQRNGCRQERYSCFQVSPAKLYSEAKASEKAGFSSPYFPSFYGEVLGPFHDLNTRLETSEIDVNTTFRLAYRATHTQTSLVTLTFAAEGVTFVQNRSPGRITETFVQDFEALGGSGELLVRVQNTGSISSDYSVSIDSCSSGIIRVSDRHQTIDPLQYGEFVFEISSSINQDKNHTCTVTLFDNSGATLDMRNIEFSAFRTCYCAGQCNCECNGRVQKSNSVFCTEDNFTNPFWNPNIILVPPCSHCWFTNALRNPVSLIVFVLVGLLSLGMFKLLFLHTCCRAKDGRPIDLVGLILGTTSEEHTKRKTRQTTIHFLLGACFFIYLPVMPLLVVFCNWRRRLKAKKRLKKKMARKKLRMINKRKKALKAMKGVMVTKGLTREGVTMADMVNVMDEGFKEEEDKKKKKKAKKAKLVVSSSDDDSSTDTSDQDFDYSTSSGDEASMLQSQALARYHGAKAKKGKGKKGGFGGDFMATLEKQATKQMAKEVIKMGAGAIF